MYSPKQSQCFQPTNAAGIITFRPLTVDVYQRVLFCIVAVHRTI